MDDFRTKLIELLDNADANYCIEASIEQMADAIIALLPKNEPVAYLVSDFVPGDPERDAVASRMELVDPDQHDYAVRYAEDPGPVMRQLYKGPLHIYRVVRDQ